jgi:molecular chaperone GrpE
LKRTHERAHPARDRDAAQAAEATDLPPQPEEESRLAILERELASAKDSWLRAEADLQNVRRRAAKDVEEAERSAFDRQLGTILSFTDDLERALRSAEQAGEKGPLVTGVALVLARLLENLKSHGIEPIDPQGQTFDPHEHEALMSVPSATEPVGQISQVIAKGYRQGDRLVRPARVLVSSGPGGPGSAPGGDSAPGSARDEGF